MSSEKANLCSQNARRRPPLGLRRRLSCPKCVHVRLLRSLEMRQKCCLFSPPTHYDFYFSFTLFSRTTSLVARSAAFFVSKNTLRDIDLRVVFSFFSKTKNNPNVPCLPRLTVEFCRSRHPRQLQRRSGYPSLNSHPPLLVGECPNKGKTQLAGTMLLASQLLFASKMPYVMSPYHELFFLF
jgi:hypothetical protein